MSNLNSEEMDTMDYRPDCHIITMIMVVVFIDDDMVLWGDLGDCGEDGNNDDNDVWNDGDDGDDSDDGDDDLRDDGNYGNDGDDGNDGNDDDSKEGNDGNDGKYGNDGNYGNYGKDGNDDNDGNYGNDKNYGNDGNYGKEGNDGNDGMNMIDDDVSLAGVRWKSCARSSEPTLRVLLTLRQSPFLGGIFIHQIHFDQFIAFTYLPLTAFVTRMETGWRTQLKIGDGKDDGEDAG